MDIWMLAEQIQALLYGTSVCWSFVYVCLKVSRDSLHSRSQGLLTFVVAGSFFLYGFLKTLIGLISDAKGHNDLITWLINIEPGGYKIQRFTTDSTLDLWCYSHMISILLPFILFINITSRLVKMSTLELCAYSWLALGGALNVAFPLFLLRYHSAIQDQTRNKTTPLRLPTWGLDVLGICLWLSFWFTVSLLNSEEGEVTHHLWLLHFVLFLPCFIPTTPFKSNKDHFMPLPIYCGLTVLITGHFWYQSMILITGDGITNFLHHNLSHGISHDLMFCFLSFILYILYHSKNLGFLASLLFIFLTPIVSLGSTFSLLVIYNIYYQKERFLTKED